MKNKLLEEERKLKRLKFIVDLAQATLIQSDITLQEACKIMENTKKLALILFPDKENVYNLIYTPRFSRIISERFNKTGTLISNN
ncbi:MAG: hypothetical protein GY928_03205 [Colwellia sp.]|nr:hypothetical protein [Colwellia sp.]